MSVNTTQIEPTVLTGRPVLEPTKLTGRSVPDSTTFIGRQISEHTTFIGRQKIETKLVGPQLNEEISTEDSLK